MIIKTFRAESSASALKRVREEMGGDAVVLKTTQISGAGGRPVFEVTACLENPTVAQSNRIFPDMIEEKELNPRIAPDDIQETMEETLLESPEEDEPESPVIKEESVQNNRVSDENIWKNRFMDLDDKINRLLQTAPQNQISEFSPFETVFELLQEHDFESNFLENFYNDLRDNFDRSEEPEKFAERKLVEKISGYMQPGFSLKKGDRVAVIGPAGSGKSSVIGKLAAQLVMKDRKKVTLLTLDDVKVGAFDQTASYAEILGAEYADNRSDLSKFKKAKDSIILIDTVALPKLDEDISPIKEKLDAIGTTYRLAVFSALTRSRDVAAITGQIKTLEATHLVITMTDLTTCLGSLVTAAAESGLKIICTTDFQGGVGSLNNPDPASITRKVLHTEVISE